MRSSLEIKPATIFAPISNLFDDCLKYFKNFQICASIDGTGEIGEYVRTGLNYNQWLENIKYGIKFLDHDYKRMQLDLTITLPGLFDLENMVLLANELQLELLTKQVFSFSSDTAMSPLFMPKELLDEIIDEVRNKTIKHKSKFTKNFFQQLDEMQTTSQSYLWLKPAHRTAHICASFPHKNI